MSLTQDEMKMKIEMLERIISIYENELQSYKNQIAFILTNGRQCQHTKVIINEEIQQDLYATMKKNMEKINDTTIKGYLESRYPAEIQMIQIIEKILNGDCTEGVLIKFSGNGLCRYKENNEIKSVMANVLFDRIFKEIYEYLKKYAMEYPEEGYDDDVMYTKSSNCYNNLMMLTNGKNYKNKEKIQKEIIRIVKNNAFSNK